MKTVLITGANSYIGTSFEKYVAEHYSSEIRVDVLDMVDGSWREHSFKDGEGKPYDCVFHVAGIAHADVGRASKEEKKRYYSVNTDLAIECATKAKECGSKQFILMSSMIVYGKASHISRETRPHPANFYGDSKWRADKGVRGLRSEGFTVTVLRPPMIYGKGSRGNYQQLSKIAKRTPFFPEYQNKRSMLYIENLCEFVSLVIMQRRGGVFAPQNAETVSTSRIVELIGESVGRRVRLVRALNPAVEIVKRFPVKKIRDLGSKAFGDSWYEESMSKYKGIDYQRVGVEESIRRTEAQ